MKVLLKYIVLFFISFYFVCNLYSESSCNLMKSDSFFPEWKELEQEDIEYYYFTVPENWSKENGKKIKLAVTVVKSKITTSNNPTIFIQGGPGGSAISGLWRWLGHPLREVGDIILVDLRGNGFSEPELCPDLGEKFFEIFAKNQSKENDTEDKVRVSVECLEDLIERGIDINAYNSFSVIKDLHALMEELSINKWNIYGVSYGTLIAQLYADSYPQDIKSLILDSPVSSIPEYYNKNSSNYVSSLNEFFKACKDNLESNKAYPDLEKIYYTVIEDLEKNPVTVDVDTRIIASGKFTYNVEDFKILIQQGLYNKSLIELLPFIIYQFYERKEEALGNLIVTFSGALHLDYGVYYCHICNEIIPYCNIDSLSKFEQEDLLKGGLAFYRSDFDVCSEWNKKIIPSAITRTQDTLECPVLLFSGQFDPITPSVNSLQLKTIFPNSKAVYAYTYGHAPSFSMEGNELILSFIKSGSIGINDSVFSTSSKVRFISGISLNPVVTNIAKKMNKQDWLLWAPLLIASCFLLFYIFYFIKETKNNLFFKIVIFVNCLVGIFNVLLIPIAIYQSAYMNRFILIFGVIDKFYFINWINNLFLLLSILSILTFIFKFRILKNKKIYFLVLFSIVVINVYYYIGSFF